MFFFLGIEQDVARAITHYKVAANLGNALALHTLGRIYQITRGMAVKKNLTTSFAFLKLAASQGYDFSLKEMTQYKFRNFDVYQIVRNICFTLILEKKFRKQRYVHSFFTLPTDIIVYIAKTIWETRKDRLWYD